MADDEANINDDATPETPEGEPEQQAAEPEEAAEADAVADADADAALKAAQDAVNESSEPDAEAEGGENQPTAEELAMLAMVQEAVNDAQGDVNDAVGGVDASASASAGAAAPDPMAEAASAFEIPSFDEPAATGPKSGIDLLGDVNLDVKIELGRTRMFIEDVLKLGDGAVVELDKLAGDPVDIYVNDRHIARGEVLVLNDNFCVRINEIIKPAEDEPSAA